MAGHSSALIIENDEKLTMIFAEALKLAEFETEIFQDGDIALARLASATPDIIILDLHVPNVSGLEILDYIKENPRLIKTHVVIITADSALAESLQDTGHLALLKPVSFRHLHGLAMKLRGLNPIACC